MQKTTNNNSESQEFCLTPTHKVSLRRLKKPEQNVKVASNEPVYWPTRSEKRKQRYLDFFEKRTVPVNDAKRVIGQDNCRAKYSDDDVRQVLMLHEEGFSLRQISEKMEIPVRTIRDYISGKKRCQSVAGFVSIKKLR